MPLPHGTVGNRALGPVSTTSDVRLHRCDDRCVCPIDGLPLLYARSIDQHACQLPDCVNAHGLISEFGGFRWAV